MTLTLTLDDELARQVQRIADSLGMSLDQLIHHCLEDLTARSSAAEDIAEIRRLSGRGSSQGWKFDRDEIHERS